MTQQNGQNQQDLPDEWETVSVEDVSEDIRYGHTASADHEINGPRFLRITDIQNGK